MTELALTCPCQLSTCEDEWYRQLNEPREGVLDLGPIHCGGENCHEIDKVMYLYGETCRKCRRIFCDKCAAGGQESYPNIYVCIYCPHY